MLELFSLPFMNRALVVGVLVSLCAALLGVSLVLKRYSMIGDGLSHVGFGALAIASVAGLAPLAVAIPVVVAAAFFLLHITENSKINGDSAIALISTSALTVGVMAVSLGKSNIDVSNYMFGSILALGEGDVVLSVILCLAVLVLFVLFYHKIFAVTFDESFARATGTSAGAFNLLIAVLTAVTVVLGMRLMGTLLISSLIVFPALTAMRVFRSFRAVTVCAALLSVVCFVAGMLASYWLSTPAGASVVCVNMLAYVLFSVVGKWR